MLAKNSLKEAFCNEKNNSASQEAKAAKLAALVEDMQDNASKNEELLKKYQKDKEILEVALSHKTKLVDSHESQITSLNEKMEKNLFLTKSYESQIANLTVLVEDMRDNE